MKRNNTRWDEFAEEDGQGDREERAVRRDRCAGSDEIQESKKRIHRHGERDDPELEESRYRKRVDWRARLKWAGRGMGGRFVDDFTRDELEWFRGMAIQPLGRQFHKIAKHFEVFVEIGAAYHVGMSSLLEVSAYLEQRQLDGEYPDDLPVSLTSLHRAVGKVQSFSQKHLELSATPWLLLSLGEGWPATRLTDIGQVMWELIREYLVSMGYEDLRDRYGSS